GKPGGVGGAGKPGGVGGAGNNGNRGNGNRGNNNVGNGNGNRTCNNCTINRNPVYGGGGAYGWNGGVAWAPVPYYYGGGFWGAMAIGVTSAAVFGSIVNTTTHETVTSYEVQPSSPGATMLSNYGLTQVQCGPANVVVVYGPDNSVICATPNAKVSAGEYTLDTETLSLVSQ
ncbi:MAG: hypothetical protein WBD74_04070, partial [Candidatus Aquilonibacter sp.]